MVWEILVISKDYKIKNLVLLKKKASFIKKIIEKIK